MTSRGAVPRAITGPSRFTHLGRHHWFLTQLLTALPRAPQTCLLLGPGPIEPFYVARLLETRWPEGSFVIDAVDESPAVVDILQSLQVGSPVPLRAIATTCCDNCDASLPRENTNFTTRLDAGLREVAESGAPSLFTRHHGSLLITPSTRSQLRVSCVTAEQFVRSSKSNQYDFAYLGLLLTNLRKENPDAPQELLTHLAPVLGQGLLGVGSSLSPEHGAGKDLLDLEAGDLHPLAIGLENLVRSHGKIYGDYGILAVADGNAPSVEAAGASRWSSHRVPARLTSSALAQAVDGSREPHRLVLAAVRNGDSTWDAWSADFAEVAAHVNEDERLWLSSLEFGRVKRGG